MGEINMSGQGAGSFGKSSSNSRSSGESGVSAVDRGRAAGGAFQTLADVRPIIDQFLSNPSMLNLNSSGLTPGAQNVANNMVRTGVLDQFNKLSAGGALRGQVNPQNTSNIIGNATERAVASALPQFLQQAQGNEMFNATSNQLTQGQGINFLQGLASLFTGLTQGSSQESTGSSKAFNIAMSGGGGAGGGGSI